jgi:hypothetical protein
MTEPEGLTPDGERNRSVRILRNAVERFKRDVSLSDLDHLGTEARTLGAELRGIGRILSEIMDVNDVKET